MVRHGSTGSNPGMEAPVNQIKHEGLGGILGIMVGALVVAYATAICLYVFLG